MATEMVANVTKNYIFDSDLEKLCFVDKIWCKIWQEITLFSSESFTANITIDSQWTESFFVKEKSDKSDAKWTGYFYDVY